MVYLKLLSLIVIVNLHHCFGNHLWSLLDTKLAMSTAFHPETDGQTERMNRTLRTNVTCIYK